MRRRRRRKGTWFPTFSTHVEGETEDSTFNIPGVTNVLPLNDDGTPVTAIHQLTWDFPHGEDPETGGDVGDFSSLADILGSEYLLQRIVGKFFAHYERSADNNAAFNCYLTAGFFVARADADQVNPIGVASGDAAEIYKSYSPQAVSTVREPWIWRRTWIIGDDILFNTAAGGFMPRYPKSTAGYGSVLDGPHIDAKTKRRVRQDDRLFFVVSATPYWLVAQETPFKDVAGAIEGSFGQVVYALDYRLFGSLRKAKQGGAF